MTIGAVVPMMCLSARLSGALSQLYFRGERKKWGGGDPLRAGRTDRYIKMFLQKSYACTLGGA